jgi:hypothetical protein
MKYKGKLYAKINGKYIQCTESVEQLENRIKELENYTTELITVKDFGFPEQMVECCGFGGITTENYCPNCGRKIIRN